MRYHTQNFVAPFSVLFILFVGTISCFGQPQQKNNLKHRNKSLKPNVVFILVDDLGWHDIGSFGSSFYDTPNVDRLAAGGMKFTNAYAAAPICSPTRASILSGKYPARLNTTDWFGSPQPSKDFHFPGWWASRMKNPVTPLMPAPYKEYLPLNEVTLAEALKAGGYSTFFAGKWHLGPDPKHWPEHQGFDVNKGGLCRYG